MLGCSAVMLLHAQSMSYSAWRTGLQRLKHDWSTKCCISKPFHLHAAIVGQSST